MTTMTPLDLDENYGSDGLTDRDRLTPAPGSPHPYVPCKHCERCLNCLPHWHPDMVVNHG